MSLSVSSAALADEMSWAIFSQFQRISLNIHKSLIAGVWKEVRMPYYAVARGRSVGIYETWADCEAQVKGFSGARYKKFDTQQNAQDFIKSEGGSISSKPKTKPPSQTLPAPPKLQSATSSNTKRKPTKRKANLTPKDSDLDDSYFSDEDDDLVTIAVKQMDDIEKRLKDFSKGIDKIEKGSGSKGKKAIMIDVPQPPKRRKSVNKDFTTDEYGYVQVYTDGACSANGTAGAKAGLGVFWGDNHELNASEPVSGRATNNCGEIQAASKAIKQALDNGIAKLTINTDSQFLINAVTKWIPGWKRKGWKLASGEPVKNEIDFKELDILQDKLFIKWNYVEAHKGIHGNEMADKLAREGAAMYRKNT